MQQRALQGDAATGRLQVACRTCPRRAACGAATRCAAGDALPPARTFRSAGGGGAGGGGGGAPQSAAPPPSPAGASRPAYVSRGMSGQPPRPPPVGGAAPPSTGYAPRAPPSGGGASSRPPPRRDGRPRGPPLPPMNLSIRCVLRRIVTPRASRRRQRAHRPPHRRGERAAGRDEPRGGAADGAGSEHGLGATATTRRLVCQARSSQLTCGLQVMISPEADPPVCRIMNYSKYRYEQARSVTPPGHATDASVFPGVEGKGCEEED